MSERVLLYKALSVLCTCRAFLHSKASNSLMGVETMREILTETRGEIFKHLEAMEWEEAKKAHPIPDPND